MLWCPLPLLLWKSVCSPVPALPHSLKTLNFPHLYLICFSLSLLTEFILRARVWKFYRQALRIARRAPDHARVELQQTIRRELENNRNCRDKQRIRFLISEGMERLKGLDEMLDMQGH